MFSFFSLCLAVFSYLFITAALQANQKYWFLIESFHIYVVMYIVRYLF